ncbi:hypothetical protein Pelo_4364 [Pelomyxa schiedti]|nr:hypothetical protein Pelo_4364 [Pelomyxa schiedti]
MTTGRHGDDFNKFVSKINVGDTREVTLKGYNLNSGMAENLRCALRTNSTLPHPLFGLFFVDVYMLSPHAGMVSTGLCGSQLVNLSIVGSHLGMEGFKEISQVLVSLPRLKKLDLSSLKEGSSNRSLPPADFCIEIASVISKSKLQSIKLQNNNINSFGMKHITEALMENFTVTELNLSCNVCDFKGASFIAELLKVNDILCVLDLYWNDIKDQGACSLSEALLINTSISKLNLSKNGIEDKGLLAMADMLAHNNTLFELNLSGNISTLRSLECLANGLQTNDTLGSLYLDENSDPAGSVYFKTLLETNSTLTFLQLNSTREVKEMVARNKGSCEAVLAKLEIDLSVNSARNMHASIRQAVQLCLHPDGSIQNPPLAQKTSPTQELCIVLNYALKHRVHFVATMATSHAHKETVAETHSVVPQKSTAATSSLFPSWETRHFIAQAFLSNYASPDQVIELLIRKRAISADWFVHQEARHLLKLLKSSSHGTCYKALLGFSRCWMKWRNWDAIELLCLSNLLSNSDVNWANLGLRDLPHKLIGELRCRSLDLRGNYLEYLPSSLHKMESVNFSGNPLSSLPASVKCASWCDVKRFLQFGDLSPPIQWRKHKVLVLGADDSGHLEITSALTRASNKLRKKSKKSGSSTGASDWTVWDLSTSYSFEVLTRCSLLSSIFLTLAPLGHLHLHL